MVAPSPALTTSLIPPSKLKPEERYVKQSKGKSIEGSLTENQTDKTSSHNVGWIHDGEPVPARNSVCPDSYPFSMQQRARSRELCEAPPRFGPCAPNNHAREWLRLCLCPISFSTMAVHDSQRWFLPTILVASSGERGMGDTT
jgi:hypothetical protein